MTSRDLHGQACSEALWIHVEITVSVPWLKLPQEPEVPGDSHPIPLHLWASAPVGICTRGHLQRTSSLRDPLHLWAGRGVRPLKDIRDCSLVSFPILTATTPLLGPSKTVLADKPPTFKSIDYPDWNAARGPERGCGQSASTSCSQVPGPGRVLTEPEQPRNARKMKSPLFPQSAGSQWEAQNL